MKLPTLLSALVVGFLLCACGSSATPPASAPPPASMPALTPRNDVPGVENFAKVSDALCRGAQPTREGFLALKQMGIKTIIDLRDLHSDTDLLKDTGLKYLNIPSDALHPETEDFLKFLKVVSDPANQPVFVHCEYGSDRTGCAVAVYRMTRQNWTPADAARELAPFGFHPEFIEITDYIADFNRADFLKKLESTKSPKLQTP